MPGSGAWSFAGRHFGRTALFILGSARIFMGVGASAQTVSLPATADTYLRQSAANQNQGQDVLLHIQQSGHNRTLVAMDPAAIAAAVGTGHLASATLELYVTDSTAWGTAGRTVELHRMTASWTENGATWNCAVDTNPANGAPNCSTQWDGGTFDDEPTDSVLHVNTTSGYVAWNVTEDVRSFLAGTPNYGWLAKLSDETLGGNVDYASRQGSVAVQRPRLVLVVESPAFDQVPPTIAIESPVHPFVINDTTPAISIAYADFGSGLALTTLDVKVDGVAAVCTAGASSASCEPATLGEGAHTIVATVRDVAGNEATATRGFTLLIGPGLRTATFVATADTTLKKSSANQNYGDEPTLRLRQSGKNRSIVRFGTAEVLQLVNQGTLRSASLELFLGVSSGWGKSGRNVDAHRLTADWSEGGATWNCAIDSIPSNGAPNCATQWVGGTFAAAPTATVLHTNGQSGTVSFDVTADLAAVVAGGTDFGWLVKKTDETKSGKADYASREAGAATAPRLVVLFEVPSGGDATPPDIAIVRPAGTVYNQHPVVVGLRLADAGSGIDFESLTVSVGGVDVSSYCGGTAEGSECRFSAPAPGPLEIAASVRDRAGNSASASATFDLVDDPSPPAIDVVSPLSTSLTEGEIPATFEVSLDDAGSGIAPGSFVVTLDGSDLSGCTLETAGASCALPSNLGLGGHPLEAFVRDRADNQSSVFLELNVGPEPHAPEIAVTGPTGDLIHGRTLPELVIEYADAQSGIDPTSFRLEVDGVEATAGCAAGPTSATCPSRPLDPGRHSIVAAISDHRGNVGSANRQLELSIELAVSITEPSEAMLVRSETVRLAGTVSPLATSVTVGSIPASLSGGTWVVENLPLREGGNTLTVVARSPAGGIGSATATVVRDTEAPRVVIQSPADGSISSAAEVFVSGEVIDPASSNVEHPPLTVTVNGEPATVDLRSFVLPEELLHPGENRIEVEATDTAGNVGRASVTVSYLADAPAHVEPISGNFQDAEIRQAVPEPLVVRVADAFGRSLPGRSVEFRVSRGDGSVVSYPDRGRKLSVLTDENGLAEVRFELGSRAGAGNHEVTVTLPGIPGAAVFCASARAAKAKWIQPIVGNDFSGERTGTAGRPLPKPLLVQVFDERGNPVSGVEATFDAIAGGGSFDGLPQVRRVTDREGKASAVYILGPGEGTNNNVVSATFATNEAAPAVFRISGRVPGPAEQTSVSGILLDPEDGPIPGARIHVGTLETRTDAEGRFHLTGVPVGTIHLEIDGSTVTRPGTWPPLGYELVTVAGRDNGVGKPLRLPQIDSAGKMRVGGDHDVTIPIRGVAGATLTVFAHSVTFPDGSHEGDVAFTQVPAQKVPMIAPMNAGFMLAWTIQPAGVRFEPPAQVSIPNFGLPGGGANVPGMTGEIFSFDHDLGEFVSAGTASITEDGRMMRSNPGMGITKTGWGGCPHPPAPPASACGEGTCNDCLGNQPIAKAKLGPVVARANGRDMPRLVRKGEPVSFTLDVTNPPSCALDVTWTFGEGSPVKGDPGSPYSASHTFAKEGAFTVQVEAKCPECDDGPQIDTIDLGVIDPAPSELTFKGAGFHEVLQDTGAGAYKAPHWKDMSSPPNGTAEDMGDHRFPVIYKRGSMPIVDLKVDAKAAGLTATLVADVRIRGGVTSPALHFPAKKVSLEGRLLTLKDLASDAALPNAIDRLDPFEISWEISFDAGNSWEDLGKTSNRIYVTLDDPLPAAAASLYETVVDIGSRNAAHQSSPGSAVTAIFEDFMDRVVTRKERDGFNRPDGKTMQYWSTDRDLNEVIRTGGCQLLSRMINPKSGAAANLNGIGTCQAWAALLHRSIQAMGIEGSQVFEVKPDVTKVPKASSMLISKWLFAPLVRPGANRTLDSEPDVSRDEVDCSHGQTGINPDKVCIYPGEDRAIDSNVLPDDVVSDLGAHPGEPYPYRLFDRVIYRKGDVFDLGNHAAQGTADSPSIFDNHFIMTFQTQGVYDPSYGRWFADPVEFGNQSVDGFIMEQKTPGLPTSARKKSQTDNELLFVPQGF